MLYTTNWAQWRMSANNRPAWCDPYAYTPKHIDPSVPTHINYAFAKINPSTYAVEAIEFNDDKLLQELQALKKSAPGLKTLISIGGWSFSRGSEVFTGTGVELIFPAMAASAANRAAFVSSAVAFAKKYGMNGVDIDWE